MRYTKEQNKTLEHLPKKEALAHYFHYLRGGFVAVFHLKLKVLQHFTKKHNTEDNSSKKLPTIYSVILYKISWVFLHISMSSLGEKKKNQKTSR